MSRIFFLILTLALPLAAKLQVQVWPEQMQVRPGQVVRLQITVTGNEPAGPVAVQCQIRHRFDTVATEMTGQTDAAGKLMLSFTPQEEFGYDVQVTATANGQTAAGSEVFTCAANPWETAPGYTGDSLRFWSRAPAEQPLEPAITVYIAKWIGRCREQYLPVTEILSIAYCPFSSITPPEPFDNYISGQGHTVYKDSVRALRTLIDGLHANGLYAVAYVNNAVSGVGGTEFARKHPEYLCYNRDGSISGGINTRTLPLIKQFYDQYPASLNDKKLVADLTCAEPGGLHIAPLNFASLALVDEGIRSLKSGRTFFNLDGVRYDGHYNVAGTSDPLAPAAQTFDWQGKPMDPKEADQLCARNMNHTLREVRKTFPDYLFGFNTAMLTNPAGTQLQEAQAIVPGNYILDETAKHVDLPAESRNLWAVYIREMTAQADRARQLRGFLFAGWGGSPGKAEVTAKYIKAISWAGGFRYIEGGAGPWTRVYNRFCCRYSEYILSNDLQRLPLAEVDRNVTVAASRPLFYREFVQRLDGHGSRCLVLHLVNAPQEERIVEEMKLPPAAEAVSVTLDQRLFGSNVKAVNDAWLLSPETEPQTVKLTLDKAEGKIILRIPQVKFWTVAVMPY